MVNKPCLSTISYLTWLLGLFVAFAIIEDPSIVLVVLLGAFCVTGGFLTSEIIYRLNGR